MVKEIKNVWKELIIILVGGLLIIFAVALIILVVTTNESPQSRQDHISAECQAIYKDSNLKGFMQHLDLRVCYSIDESGIITFLELPEVKETD